MKKVILFIILIAPVISIAQESSRRVLLLKNNILPEYAASITVDPIRINQNTENSSAFCTLSFGAANLFVTPKDTIIKHKLLLYRTLVSSSNYMNGRWTSSSSMKITGFKVEDLNSYEFHHLMRELKPYVKDDKKALRLYRSSRVYQGIEKGSIYFNFGLILAGIYEIASGKAQDPDGLKPIFHLFYFGMGTYVVTNILHSLSLRKCIKVYNKNAGFGFVNGLEKIKNN